ncbi:MAG: type II secretion system protein J [Leptothrix sp. (in: b-proteobacteria)]
MTGRSPASHRGFTLIEVLVALFIMSMMAAMAWQGVDMVVRSRDIAQGRMETLLRLQSTLAQWDTDLRESFDTHLVPGVQFDGANLRLTRRQPGGAQVVVWSLRGGTLQRWAAEPVTSAEALQDAWLQSYQLQGQESGQLNALPGVTQWQVYTYSLQSQSWSNAQSTGDLQADGNQAARQALPDGVRLVLQFTPGSGLAGSVTRDARLVHP